MGAAKRFGWAMVAVFLLIVAALASMVRITTKAPLPSPAPSGAPSALAIPVAGVAVDQLADSWGDARGEGTRAHHAVDILAARGTPVLAAAPGTVEKLHQSVDGGLTLYVRSPDGGTIHYYAHLDSIAVAEGQPVRQGERIATVGNTGSAASGAPHLHFEVKAMQPGERWWQGVNVNPYPLLARTGDGG